MSLEQLIIAVAAEALQFYEFLSNQQFYGVSTGNNDIVSNYFTNPLRVSSGRPDGLREAFRNLGSSLGGLIGYASSHNLDTPYARMTLLFCRYAACLGIENGSYFSSMGKYRPGITYAPLSKYVAIQDGVGPIPNYTISNVTPFTTMIGANIQRNTAHFFLDGDGIILISHGNPGQAIVPPELLGTRFSYTNVCRSRINGTDHGDVPDMSQLRLKTSGSIGPIYRCGLIDFTEQVDMERFIGSVVLRFTGHIHSITDVDMWLGNYPNNVFDGVLYVYAFSQMRALNVGNNHTDRLNPVWQTGIRNCPHILPAVKTQLSAFTRNAIFSPECMEVIALDQSYMAGTSQIGKRSMAKLLSVLYALYTLITVTEYMST